MKKVNEAIKVSRVTRAEEREARRLVRLAAKRARWANTDWGMNDASIARMLKVSREAVRQQRKVRGEAKSGLYHKSDLSAESRLKGMETAELTDKQVRARLGLKTLAMTRVLLKRLEKPFVRSADGREKYNWKGVNWSLSDREVAVGLRCKYIGQVARRRKLMKLLDMVAYEGLVTACRVKWNEIAALNAKKLQERANKKAQQAIAIVGPVVVNVATKVAIDSGVVVDLEATTAPSEVEVVEPAEVVAG